MAQSVSRASFFSGISRGESTSLPFLASRGHQLSLAHGALPLSSKPAMEGQGFFTSHLSVPFSLSDLQLGKVPCF